MGWVIIDQYYKSILSPGNNNMYQVYNIAPYYPSGNMWLEYHKLDVNYCLYRHTGLNNANFAIQQTVSNKKNHHIAYC